MTRSMTMTKMSDYTVARFDSLYLRAFSLLQARQILIPLRGSIRVFSSVYS